MEDGGGEQVVAIFWPPHDTLAQWRTPEGRLERIRMADVSRPVRVILPDPRHANRIGSDQPCQHTDSIIVPTRPWRPTFLALSDVKTGGPRLVPTCRVVQRDMGQGSRALQADHAGSDATKGKGNMMKLFTGIGGVERCVHLCPFRHHFWPWCR